MKELLQRAKELEPEMLENRRWLHRHPELGFELHETCAFVEKKLKAMGYAPQRMSKTGIAVSYTHLDVYKRQVLLWRGWRCLG